MRRPEARKALQPRVIDGRWYDPRDHGFTAVLCRDRCAYCDAPSQTLDHIDPVAAGGDDSIENLTGACYSCNSSKGGKSLLGFLGFRINRAEAEAQRRRLDEQRRGWHELGVTA